MRRFNIDWMGKRKIMFAISAVLLTISIGALALRGLTFGIEFLGGTQVNITDAGEASNAQITEAFKAAGVEEPIVQTARSGQSKGFIVRTELDNAQEAAGVAREVATALSLPEDRFQVTTIGPGWGSNITNRSLLALAVSILAILLYISVRFEYKMSITAVIGLVHDMTITLGIYSLLGQEVTPNTVAALLTILGYSLYDTVVVFHRMNENARSLTKQTFSQMANDSINEVIVRSLNTALISLVPVVTMLLIGGETLYDFALALTIGLGVGGYSSVGVSSPLFVMWKETEPKYAALKKKYAG